MNCHVGEQETTRDELDVHLRLSLILDHIQFQLNREPLGLIPKARRPDSFHLRESSDSFGVRRFAPCRQP